MIRIRAAIALAGAAALAHVAACKHASESDARFPPRPAGCDVKLFPGTPDVGTDNIGPVHVRCGEDIAEADCKRTLMDQVCALGGDVVWGIGDAPTMELGKNNWYGRAAHTKVARTDAGAPGAAK